MSSEISTVCPSNMKQYFLRNLGNTSFDGTTSYPRRSQSTWKNFPISHESRYFTTLQTNMGFLKSYNVLYFLQSMLGKNVQADTFYVLKPEVPSRSQVLFTLWILHARISNGHCVTGKGSVVALLILHQQLNTVKSA